jgi:dUTP pyrophosphatase
MALPTSIRRLRADIELPRYQTPGAAGFDLAASEDVIVQPGQVVLVPTGLVIQAPPGHFLAIVARSSTPMKRGLMVANGVGIVDEDYCGPNDEVKIEVVNFTQQAVKVARGDRLAQGLFIPVVRAEWRETDGDMREGSRGGFGATGA